MTIGCNQTEINFKVEKFSNALVQNSQGMPHCSGQIPFVCEWKLEVLSCVFDEIESFEFCNDV